MVTVFSFDDIPRDQWENPPPIPPLAAELWERLRLEGAARVINSSFDARLRAIEARLSALAVGQRPDDLHQGDSARATSEPDLEGLSSWDGAGERNGNKEPTVATPYLNVEEAARYLRKTPKAIYGLIERRRLRKMPGSRVCYFTNEMLDEFLRGETANGRGVRPGRRKKG